MPVKRCASGAINPPEVPPGGPVVLSSASAISDESDLLVLLDYDSLPPLTPSQPPHTDTTTPAALSRIPGIEPELGT